MIGQIACAGLFITLGISLPLVVWWNERELRAIRREGEAWRTQYRRR